ncbi:hypothetical protein LDJ93_08545 [Fusobacterium nucleatum]|uniref:hypothetical protein n=1 Tax=Fusobacterium vincentii TaxID=155615 RepID=UPI000413C12A|nr:hypothetical protein [Fusobacterium vincentii]PIH01932.1 hypothetical protein CS399_05875 [Fusobacterium vincentii]
MEKIFTGYHGTVDDNIEEILESILNRGFYISNGKNQWLGKGIYLFDNVSQARWWCETQKEKSLKYGIIEVTFSCDSSKILDLDNQGDREKYIKAIKKYKNMIEEKKLKFNSDEEALLKIQCLILSMYKKDNNIDMMKKTFYLEKELKLKFDVMSKTHTQYCLTSEESIKEKQIRYYRS